MSISKAGRLPTTRWQLSIWLQSPAPRHCMAIPEIQMGQAEQRRPRARVLLASHRKDAGQDHDQRTCAGGGTCSWYRFSVGVDACNWRWGSFAIRVSAGCNPHLPSIWPRQHLGRGGGHLRHDVRVLAACRPLPSRIEDPGTVARSRVPAVYFRTFVHFDTREWNVDRSCRHSCRRLSRQMAPARSWLPPRAPLLGAGIDRRAAASPTRYGV